MMTSFDGFTNPFRYVPHPLVRKAAGIAMRRVSCLADDLRRAFEEGKMMGVMVVEVPSEIRDFNDWLCEDERLGFLCAFSGSVAGRGAVEGFVPPIFDLCEPGGYYRARESEISILNRRIACLEGFSELAGLREELSAAERSRDEEIGLLKARMAVSKRERDEIRSELADQSRLAELVRESQFEKAELHRLKVSWNERIAEIKERLQMFDDEVDALKKNRAQMSDDLQRWIFGQYAVHNALGEVSTIRDIFAGQGLVPQGGTGDCAAPKLLNHAYIMGLRPLAMGEFWYGVSPDSAVRVHGHFYPSCTSKCGPLLGFMMKGLFRKGGFENLNPSHDKSWIPADGLKPYCFGTNVHSRFSDGLATAQKATGGHVFSRPPFRNSLKEQLHEVQSVDIGTFRIPKSGYDGPEPEVIFEDEWIVVVEKPAGLPSIPGLDGRGSVLEWLNGVFGECRYEAVHRLDMDTSGVMVFARTSEAAVSLRRQFEDRSVSKTYIARLSASSSSEPLVTGRKGVICLPLGPDYDERPRQKADRAHGKEAVTEYEVASLNQDGTADLVFHPVTGRSHQLRVHSAHPLGLGRPILGDLLYGGYSVDDEAATAGRLHLHALEITFRHPFTGKTVRFCGRNFCYD